MVVVPALVLLASVLAVGAGARLMQANETFRQWPSIVFPLASIAGGISQVLAVSWLLAAGRPSASGLTAIAADALREEVFRFAAEQPGLSGLRAAGCAPAQYALGSGAGLGWAEELADGLPLAGREAADRIPIPGPVPACAIQAGLGTAGVQPSALWTASANSQLDPERVSAAASLQAGAKAVVVRVSIDAGCAAQGMLAWAMALAGRAVMVWLLEAMRGAMTDPELKGAKLAQFSSRRARGLILRWAVTVASFGMLGAAAGVWRPGVFGCALEGPGMIRILFSLP